MKQNLIILFALLWLHTNGQNQQISVSVNTNVEVINAITIPLYPEMLQDSAVDPWLYENTQLMRVANRYFKPYYNHSAVSKAQYLIDKLGTGIYLLALYYDDLPKVKRKTEIPEIIWTEVSRNKDSASLIIDDFFKAASAFYKASSFRTFQSRYKSVYSSSLQQVRRNLPDKNFIALLEKYYGDTKSSYNIVIMPFFKSQWGMGWETTENGKKNIFNITSPFKKQVVAGEKLQDPGFDDFDKISNLSIHEFGHSFVNTITATEPYRSDIGKFNHLYKPIESAKQYSDWPTLFNEYIVRAGEILVMRQLGNASFADKTRESYKDWIYLDFFIEQMMMYTNERTKYPAFRDFLPTLIKNLATISITKS